MGHLEARQTYTTCANFPLSRGSDIVIRMVPDSIDFSRVRRVLVVKLHNHGDVLLTSPLFGALKAHARQLDIDALVYDDTADMLTFHPAVAAVHVVGRQWRALRMLDWWRHEWALLRTLRARRYDVLINLADHPRPGLLGRLLRVPVRVAPQPSHAASWWRRTWSRLAFTHRFPVLADGSRHAVETHLDALRRTGVQIKSADRRLVLVPGVEAESRVDLLMNTHGLATRQFILFHPTSRRSYKSWTIEQSAELIDALRGRGHRVVVTGDADQFEEAFITSTLAKVQTPVVNLAGRLTLKQLAALTARARLFIGVDSAPMHIAAAMQTPIVALFGPSSEREWGPWRVPARVLMSSAHPCRPCGFDGCGGGKVSECMAAIGTMRVMDTVESLLAHPS